MTKNLWSFVRVISKAMLVTLCLCAIRNTQAASIDRDTALTFATNWLAATNDPLGTKITGRTFADIAPIDDAKGATVAWNVSLNPEGFIIVAADDRINPVVAVASTGKYDDNKANPFRALILADISGRLAAVNEVAPDNATRGGEIPAAITRNKGTWAKFTNQTRAMGTEVVSEIWVDSFVKSTWNQGGGIYNYYTPTIYDRTYTFDEPGNPSNIVCGCVATASAQILRYFQWPQKPIGTVSGSCTVEYRDQTNPNLPTSVSLTPNLRGGDGNGGAYKWNLMSLTPSSNEDLETYQQIGALCFDAGLSVGMRYNSKNGGESGGNSDKDAYIDKFKYAGAGGKGGSNGERANLDARRPLAVSIDAVSPDPDAPGHAIVCDGYGRLDGRWYYHMNMGWGGNNNLWYNNEENYYAGSLWTNFTFDVGNIYRQPLQKNENATTGSIFSGRVTDANGKPVAGVKVSIRKQGQSATWQTMLAWYDPKDPIATPVYRDWDQFGNNDGNWQESELPGADKYRNTTDENGIWAIDKIAAGTYDIVLEKDGLFFAGTTTATASPSSNRWGLNFVASPLENLALQNWWIDNGYLYLQFNHSVGNVDADLSKLRVGGVSLAGKTVQVSPSSNIIVVNLNGSSYSGTLEMQGSFLTIDVDGANSTDQSTMNNVTPVNAVSAISGLAQGTAPAPSKVTAITRAGAQETSNNIMTFIVTL